MSGSEIQRGDDMDIKNEAAAALAHEVKNPLSLIKMNVDHIKSSLNKEFEDNFNVIEREICKINMLVTGLSFNRQPVYLRSLIRDIINEYDISLRHRKISFEIEGEADIYAMGDREKLNILFFNIIKNAVEAIDGEGLISIKIKKRSGGADISIEDNGKGMDPLILSRAGQPYNTDKKGGTGLGLAICTSIVKEHKGNIIFENTGNGTKVKVEL